MGEKGMNKRLVGKIQKRAEQKVIAGEPLTQMERITFNKSMEHWLGPDIVARIKQFGKKVEK
jgi:hypothetical protein